MIMERFKQVHSYEKNLFNIKKKMQGKTLRECNLIWFDFYNRIKNNLNNMEELPAMLALIHPDFYPELLNSDVLHLKRNTSFVAGIRRTDNCQYNFLSGHPCLYNNLNTREVVHADHFWPNSLGGPSILENRLLLCKYHNAMKSNSVENFKWDKIPVWLPSQLNNIAALKT